VSNQGVSGGPVVTVSGSFGAGGAVIGPMVAERLGVPFLDRAIPVRVARSLDVPVEEALDHDERRPPALARFLSSLAVGGDALGATPAGTADRVANDDAFRVETERVIREMAGDSGGVILGRAGAVVLRTHPSALHVRLDGSRDARVARIMSGEGGRDKDKATKLVDGSDRAWLSYVRYFYKTDARDPTLYHVILDSTVLSFEACTEIIVQATHDRCGRQA
jgi:cytidylate kinase